MNNSDWITMAGLSKRYNQQKAINNINLSIKKGEIFALCGGNGAGKTTLIKMLTGIMQPTAGNIFINGQEVDTSSREYKRQFSYMPDEMVFARQLTGLEVLSFFAQLINISSDKVDETLQIVGLYEDRNIPIKQYSKGMQQRLSFAQSLLPNAPLRILDEPTNGLDPYWVMRFKEIIQEEKRLGNTIFFTTHILSIVEELADTAAFIDDGKVKYCDSIESLVHSQGHYQPLEKVFFR